MPIYEYHCPECGQEFEKLVYGQLTVECPSCRNPKVRRTLSLFGMKSEGAFAASACGCSSCSCGARH